LKIIATAVVVSIVGIGILLGLRELRRYIPKKPGLVRQITTARIDINRPPWMPVELAGEIARQIGPIPGSRLSRLDLAKEVYERAVAHPMIRSLKPVVRMQTDDPRVDRIVVRCEFRQPIAKVAAAGGYAIVDAEGVRLPAKMAPMWVRPDGSDGRREYFLDTPNQPTSDSRRVHYVLIQGVRAQLPPVGKSWLGDDLRDAIRLTRMIYAKTWANEITVINVENHNSRLSRTEPEIVMHAQNGWSRPTVIKFGRFPAADGSELFAIPPERRMQYIDRYVSEHGGKLTGFNTYLDLRYDYLHVSID